MAKKKSKRAKKKATTKAKRTMMMAAPPTAAMAKSDADVIREAYEDRLKNLLTVYEAGYPSDPQGSEDRFRTGLHNLRIVRDRALQLL